MDVWRLVFLIFFTLSQVSTGVSDLYAYVCMCLCALCLHSIHMLNTQAEIVAMMAVCESRVCIKVPRHRPREWPHFVAVHCSFQKHPHHQVS